MNLSSVFENAVKFCDRLLHRWRDIQLEVDVKPLLAHLLSIMSTGKGATGDVISDVVGETGMCR